MKPAIRHAYLSALRNARAARVRGELRLAFAELERAHILGQRFLWPHIVTHLAMLHIGWLRRDWREVAGQLLRLVATLPGWLSGWVPKGNPGGAAVPALKPMPVPPDLQPIVWGSGTGSEVMSRIAAPMLGGMVSAPLLSLFVIPAAFLMMRGATPGKATTATASA